MPDGDGPEIPEGAFSLDPANFVGDAPAVAADWYDYSLDTHILTPSPKLYVVRDDRGAEPAYVAFRVATYYDEDTGQSGRFTLERSLFEDGAWTDGAPWVSSKDIKTEGAVCLDLMAAEELSCDSATWQLQMRIFPLYIPEVALVVGNPGFFVRSLANDDTIGGVRVATLAGSSFDALVDPTSLNELADTTNSNWNDVEWPRDQFATNLPQRGMTIGSRWREQSAPEGDVFFLLAADQNLVRFALSESADDDAAAVRWAVSELDAASGLYVPFGEEQTADVSLPRDRKVTYLKFSEPDLLAFEGEEELDRQLTPPFEVEWDAAFERVGGEVRFLLSPSSTVWNATAGGGPTGADLETAEPPTL